MLSIWGGETRQYQCVLEVKVTRFLSCLGWLKAEMEECATGTGLLKIFMLSGQCGPTEELKGALTGG